MSARASGRPASAPGDGRAAPRTLELLPVGVPLGVTLPADGLGNGGTGRVRLGERFVELAPDGYELWLGARTCADRAALERWAADHGHADGGQEALRALAGLGMLVALPARGSALRALFERLRLVPNALALGGAAGHPEAVVLGSPSLEPLAVLEAPVFGVWARSDGRLSLWDACRRQAEQLGRAPAQLAVQVRSALPALLASATAFVDLLPGG